MLELVIALLACAALAYVALPLGRGKEKRDEVPLREDELDARKRTALTAIVDLEADRAVGKLSEDDFEALRTQYETEALAALTELDALRLAAEAPDDPLLEEEIAEMRSRLACPRCGGVRSTEGVCPQCQTTT